MNVRITPRGEPHRTDLYGGIERIRCDGTTILLQERLTRGGQAKQLAGSEDGIIPLPLRDVAAIALDEDPGDFY